MDKKDNLILVTEGNLSSVKYFMENGVYPTTVLLNVLDLKEKLPYLGENDHVLVVIKGLCDFTIQEIYVIAKELEKVKEDIGSFIILSNVDLGIENYYLYQGDVFYGKIKEIRSKKTKINTKNIVPSFFSNLKNKKRIKYKKEEEKNNIYSINEIMRSYLVFNDKKEPSIYLNENKSIFINNEDEFEKNQRYSLNILDVDLFK